MILFVTIFTKRVSSPSAHEGRGVSLLSNLFKTLYSKPAFLPAVFSQLGPLGVRMMVYFSFHTWHRHRELVYIATRSMTIYLSRRCESLLYVILYYFIHLSRFPHLTTVA